MAAPATITNKAASDAAETPNNSSDKQFNPEAANALAIEEALSSTQINQNEEQELKNQLRKSRLATNKKMVKKYQSQFHKIPSMTSEELVERWKQQDKQDDERDDSQNDSDGDGESIETETTTPKFGPLLLIDVRSKEERNVSMIQGAYAMDDLETTKWMNRNVHNFYGAADENSVIPTIVCYCTIGYRSGREAQRLVDDLTSTFGIEIGKSVQILNLDGILSYSFVEDAPPLMCTSMDAGSDYVMTRRVHSYGKEWAQAADPDFDTVYFDTKPKMLKHLIQTGFASAFRSVQHRISKSTAKAKETKVVSKTCVEPVSVPAVIPKILRLSGSEIDLKGMSGETGDGSDLRTSKRISVTGYTMSDATANTTN